MADSHNQAMIVAAKVGDRAPEGIPFLDYGGGVKSFHSMAEHKGLYLPGKATVKKGRITAIFVAWGHKEVEKKTGFILNGPSPMQYTTVKEGDPVHSDIIRYGDQTFVQASHNGIVVNGRATIKDGRYLSCCIPWGHKEHRKTSFNVLFTQGHQFRRDTNFEEAARRREAKKQLEEEAGARKKKQLEEEAGARKKKQLEEEWRERERKRQEEEWRERERKRQEEERRERERKRQEEIKRRMREKNEQLERELQWEREDQVRKLRKQREELKREAQEKEQARAKARDWVEKEDNELKRAVLFAIKHEHKSSAISSLKNAEGYTLLQQLKNISDEVLLEAKGRKEDILFKWHFPPPSEDKFPGFDKNQRNIVVCGTVSSGKSSSLKWILEGLGFPDAILDSIQIKSDQSVMRAATKFCCAAFPGLVLWDIPGYGTDETKAGKDGREYIQAWGLYWFDLTIIYTRNTLRTFDVRLANMLQEKNQNYLLVRTCMDQVVDTELAEQNFKNEEEVIENTIECMKKKCPAAQFLLIGWDHRNWKDPRSYAHAMHDHERFDFRELMALVGKIAGPKIEQPKPMTNDGALFSMLRNAQEITFVHGDMVEKKIITNNRYQAHLLAAPGGKVEVGNDVSITENHK